MLPEDRGAAFGADHGVVGVLQHEHAVGDADAERAAAAAFADDDGDDRRAQDHHLAQVHGDRFGDVALLGADAGIGAGGVDERDEGQAEFFRQPHEAQRLAIAFGIGAAEVAFDVLLQLAALLVADDDALAAADAWRSRRAWRGRRQRAGRRAVR